MEEPVSKMTVKFCGGEPMEIVPKYSIYRDGREREYKRNGGKGLFVTVSQSTWTTVCPSLGTQDDERNRARAVREGTEDSLENLVPFSYGPESPDVTVSRAGETEMPPF